VRGIRPSEPIWFMRWGADGTRGGDRDGPHGYSQRRMKDHWIAGNVDDFF
jgi:hypothetical protein